MCRLEGVDAEGPAADRGSWRTAADEVGGDERTSSELEWVSSAALSATALLEAREAGEAGRPADGCGLRAAESSEIMTAAVARPGR